MDEERGCPARAPSSAAAVRRQAVSVRPRPPLRRCASWAIQQAWFDQIVIVAIIASSICLAIDTPRLDKGSDLAHQLKRLDLFFTYFFLAEMATKQLALGFV